jgi:hypothetical protein
MSIYILYGVISFDWHFPYAIRAVHAMWNMYIHRHILYTFCAGFARHLNCVYHPCHTLNNYLHTFRMFYPITHPIPYTHVTRLFISSLSVIIRGVPKRPIKALYLCQKGTSRPITPLMELSTQREATRWLWLSSSCWYGNWFDSRWALLKK